MALTPRGPPYSQGVSTVKTGEEAHGQDLVAERDKQHVMAISQYINTIQTLVVLRNFWKGKDSSRDKRSNITHYFPKLL